MRNRPSRAATTLLVGMALFVATTIFAQKLSAERSADETTAKLVCQMVARYHMEQGEIGDETSSRLLMRFVEKLDPQKLYFLKSDIEKLRPYEHKLDDMLKEGDVSFAYDTFEVYLKRLDERIDLAHKLIDADHDFTVDENLIVDADAVDWANSTSELNERWRKRIKYDLLNLKLDDTPPDEARERLHKRYRNIRSFAHQQENFETLESFLTAMTQTFDPHSSYMSKQTLEDFRIQMELSLEGIGAALKSEDGYTVVAEIVPGGAADKDGRLKVGDRIIGVGQEEGEIVDVVEMKLSKVVRYIRGPKGTKVRLQVQQADTHDTSLYTLTRQKIELKSAEVKGEIIQSPERLGGREARIGVIRIPSFYRDFRGAQRGDVDFKSTSRDVRKVLADFAAKGGVDGLIIDLRTNGGGALTEAIEVSGLFIDHGPVVQVKERDGSITSHDDVEPGVVYSGPLVVLCNRLSASASEIFAGVIKDYRRGIIVGDSATHGKGTVQNVMPVARKYFQFLNPQNRGALKLTINQFYRVNGASTQSRGVHSDIVLPSVLDHMDLGESFLDNALEFDRIEAANYTPLDMTSPEIVSALKQRSQKRIQAAPEFQEIRQDIEEYVERKERKTVTLNEAELRKEREQDEDDKDGQDDEETSDPEQDEDDQKPVFPDTSYNNEVLRITVDYANLLQNRKTAQK